jgi:Zn-dependent protease
MFNTASLHFRIFDFPVRVHITFFLLAVLLGLGLGNIIYVLLWVVIVFISILVHELGHAFTARAYGRSPHIELYSLGGLTISNRFTLLSYPKEIFLSFSGPLAGFLMAGLITLIIELVGPIRQPLLFFFLRQMQFVNIVWGIFNLIPILPLDGGHIMRHLYHWLRSPYDERTPLKISVGFGIAAIIAILIIFRGGSVYVLLLMAWLTYNNFMALRQGYWTDNLV